MVGCLVIQPTRNPSPTRTQSVPPQQCTVEGKKSSQILLASVVFRVPTSHLLSTTTLGREQLFLVPSFLCNATLQLCPFRSLTDFSPAVILVLHSDDVGLTIKSLVLGTFHRLCIIGPRIPLLFPSPQKHDLLSFALFGVPLRPVPSCQMLVCQCKSHTAPSAQATRWS